MNDYEITLPDGRVVAVKAGSREEATRAAQNFQMRSPQRGASITPPGGAQMQDDGGTSWDRGVGLGAMGFNDAVAGTLGAPVDLTAFGLRQLGVPANDPLGGSKTFRDVFDYAATAPGRAVDAVSQGSLSPLAEPRTARDEARNDTEKLIYGAGKGVGGAASFFVPGAAVAKMAPANTATQGVARSMAAQPVMQTAAGGAGGATAELTGDPLIGLAASLAVPGGSALARRAITPAGDSYLNDEMRRLSQVLSDAGVPMTAGQQTGAPFLRTIESVMKQHPFTSAVANADVRTQQGAFGKAVTGLTGDAVSEASPQWLLGTKARLGRGFEDVANRNTVNLDQPFLTDLHGVVSEYGNTLNALQKPVFQRVVGDIINTGTAMSGPAYQATRAKLGRIADSASKNDPEFSRAMGGLQKALDDAMERSISPADASLWKELRTQYGAFKTIDDTMGSTTATGGNIPPTQLRVQAERRNNPQMRDLAEAGQLFVKDSVPNSGTPQRLVGLGALNAGGYAAGVDPFLLAAATLGPPAVQAAIRSGPGRAYLTNNLMNGVESPLSKQLMLDMLTQRELQDAQAPARR